MCFTSCRYFDGSFQVCHKRAQHKRVPQARCHKRVQMLQATDYRFVRFVCTTGLHDHGSLQSKLFGSKLALQQLAALSAQRKHPWSAFISPFRTSLCSYARHETQAWCAGGSVAKRIPLSTTGLQAASLPLAAIPAEHPVHHVATLADLPGPCDGGQLSVEPLLFPGGVPSHTEQPPFHIASAGSATHQRSQATSSCDASNQTDLLALPTDCSNVVGFDVEWRPKLGRNTMPASWSNAARDGIAAPAAVVQLTSVHATVVVNLFALGTDMQRQRADKCGTGARKWH